MSKSTKERIYLTAYPHLVAEWHSEKNGDLDPATITHGSEKRVWWLCRVCGGEWKTTPNNRTRRSGCPVCSNKKILRGFNDLMTTHPELSKEWSPRNEFGPETMCAGSKKRVWWVCAEHSHEWAARVDSRARGNGCPVCANRKVLPGFNDLVTTHPELSKEWSPKNGDLVPEMVSAGTGKKIEWVCGDGHSWVSTVYHRALYGSGCPKCCTNRTSKIEGELHRLLFEKFSDADPSVKIGRWSVDVFLRKERVVVEYDGAYFHKDRVEYDTQKTLDLLTRGYGVVRVRERGREYTLPPLKVNEPHYLELTYDYSKDWSGLSDVADRINSWVTSGYK